MTSLFPLQAEKQRDVTCFYFISAYFFGMYVVVFFDKVYRLQLQVAGSV